MVTTTDSQIIPATASNGGGENHGVEAMAALRFRIPGDVIALATKEMPEEQRAAVRWFAGYCRDRNLDKDRVATLLNKRGGGTYSWDSIYQLLTGRRAEQNVDITPVIEAIESFRKKVQSDVRLGDSGFVRTRLATQIEQRLDRARALRKIAFIFGDSQIGKTVSLVQYEKEHNHGETIYVEAPTGGALTMFIEVLARKLAIPRRRAADLRSAIIECFDKDMLLIVDEAHRFLHNERGVHSLDFIRELYNKAGCGITLSMTNEGRDLLRHGPHKTRLLQLWRRRIAPLQLPAVTPEDDLALFAHSYGLPTAPKEEVGVSVKYLDEKGGERTKTYTDVPLDVQRRVNADEGLGVWLSILQDAADIAKLAKKPITWAAVLKAYCMMQADSEVLK